MLVKSAMTGFKAPLRPRSHTPFTMELYAVAADETIPVSLRLSGVSLRAAPLLQRCYGTLVYSNPRLMVILACEVGENHTKDNSAIESSELWEEFTV